MLLVNHQPSTNSRTLGALADRKTNLSELLPAGRSCRRVPRRRSRLHYSFHHRGPSLECFTPGSRGTRSAPPEAARARGNVTRSAMTMASLSSTTAPTSGDRSTLRDFVRLAPPYGPRLRLSFEEYTRPLSRLDTYRLGPRLTDPLEPWAFSGAPVRQTRLRATPRGRIGR